MNEYISEWEMVDKNKQMVYDEADYVSAIINHFSIYCLMGTGGDLDVINMVNYPNPFSDRTAFTFEITRDADVILGVYTIGGRLVKKYEVENMEAGYNEIPEGESWDGKDENSQPLANGVYIYKITVTPTPTGGGDAVSKTGKLVIMR